MDIARELSEVKNIIDKAQHELDRLKQQNDDMKIIIYRLLIKHGGEYDKSPMSEHMAEAILRHRVLLTEDEVSLVRK